MAKTSTPHRKPRKPPYPGEHPPHHHHPRKPLTLETLEKLIMAVSQLVTDALAAQDAKIASLSQKVDDFIAAHQSNSAADDAAIVDRVNAQGAAVDQIAAKLA